MTVISRKHSFIYLKSRKTAGTAVEAHLLKSTRLGNDIWHTASDILKHGLPMKRKHFVWSGLGGSLVAIPEPPLLTRRYFWRFLIEEHHEAAPLSRRLGGFWNRALKATNVRNPWDIMVSAWAWRRDGKGGQAPPITADFHEWAEAALSGDDEWRERVSAYDTRKLMDPFVFVDGHPAVDVFIRQERIDHGLQEIGRRLGIDVPFMTVKEKASSRKRDFRRYYSDELAESVGDYFAEIISLFGYRFDPDETEVAGTVEP